ncbi:MAG: hypothetical protein JWR59_846 [Brevundimonas sp.]|nr:hypothetical protein [Brevundimonas sp.]
MLLPQLSAIGWFHTLGSLPAVPIALYLLIRHGRILPGTPVGKAYLFFMFVGALSGVIVIKDPPGVLISILSLGSLLVGSTVGKIGALAKHHWWIETTALSVSVFTLFLPSLTETLTRLPAGHPIAASPQAPLVVMVQLSLLVILILGLTLQLRFLKPKTPATVAA